MSNNNDKLIQVEKKDNKVTPFSDNKFYFRNFSLVKADLTYLVVDEEGISSNSTATEAQISDLLVRKTSVKDLRFDTNSLQFFVYLPERGFYREVTKETLESMISVLLKTVVGHYLSSLKIKGVVSCLKQHEIVSLHQRDSYKRLVFFEDGVLDLVTGASFPHSERFFITEDRQLKMVMPDFSTPLTLESLKNFYNFVQTFTGYDRDAFTLIRFLIKSLYIPKQYEKLLLISGYSGTGKSAFSRLMQVLVGRDNFVSSSFRLLRDSRFESSMFKGKKLVLLSDTTINEKDLSVLKDITGGDAVPSEEKYKQRSSDFFFEGLVVIVTNDEVVEKIKYDFSGALQRRVISIRTIPHCSQQQRVDLISNVNVSPKGVLAKELPNVLRWCLSMDDHLGELLMDSQKFKLNNTCDLGEVGNRNSIMIHFIKEHFIISRRDSVLLGWGTDKPSVHKCWVDYCSTHNVSFAFDSPKQFQEAFMYALALLKINNLVEIRKTAYGKTYFGLRIRDPLSESKNINDTQPIQDISPLEKFYPEYTDEQSFMLFTENSKEKLLSLEYKQLFEDNEELSKYKEFNFTITSQKRNLITIDSTSSDTLIERYRTLYHMSDERVFLSDFSKEALYLIDVQEIVDINLKGKNISSKGYIEYSNLLYERYQQDKVNLCRSGLVVYGYSFSKLKKSNRLQPTSYIGSIHSTSRIFREQCLEIFSCELQQAELGKICVSIDLKACFLNLIMGILPGIMDNLIERLNVEKSIWKILESDIKEKMPDFKFLKAPVKICLYSKLFGAGQKGMVNGILTAERKRNLVQTQADFVKLDLYPDLLRNAIETVEACEASDLFKNISDAKRKIRARLLQENSGNVIGPAGINIDLRRDFNSGLSCLLQDYEIFIISNLGLKLKDKLSYFEPIIHLHDGFVAVIDIQERELLLQIMINFESDIKKELNLYNEHFGFDIEFYGEDAI
jgi:hypothetical protein